MGFRYLASSIPIICLTGVAIGVGSIFSSLIFAISRNPAISNNLIRWSFIGFSLVEVSGFVGLVFSFLLLYALLIVLDPSLDAPSFIYVPLLTLLYHLSFIIQFILCSTFNYNADVQCRAKRITNIRNGMAQLLVYDIPLFSSLSSCPWPSLILSFG